MSSYNAFTNHYPDQSEPSNMAERWRSTIGNSLLSPQTPDEGLALSTQIAANLRKQAVRCFHTDDTERFLTESLPGNAKAGRSTVYIFSDDSALFFGDVWRNDKWIGTVCGTWEKPPSENIVPIEEAPKGSPLLLEEPAEEGPSEE